MAAPLEPKLADLLVRLVELDAGEYQTFVPSFSGGGGDEADLIGLGEDAKVPEGPIRELADRDLLDMEVEPGKRLGKFRITPQGRSLAAQLATTGGGAIDLSWSFVSGILGEIYNLWRSENAPPLGVTGEAIQARTSSFVDSAQLASIIRELERAEWVECRTALGRALPRGVLPTPRTTALMEGWPTPDAKVVGEQFITQLEERIEEEPDEEKRSKLRQTLKTGGTTFRELSVEVAGAFLARQVGAS